MDSNIITCNVQNFEVGDVVVVNGQRALVTSVDYHQSKITLSRVTWFWVLRYRVGYVLFKVKRFFLNLLWHLKNGGSK